MNTNSNDVLLALQHGDSFFPCGAIAMSAGLETLVSDGTVQTADQVEELLFGQLRCRWSTFDRPILIAAHRSAGELDQIAQVDMLVEAQTLAAELREGSRRAGAALLGVHVKLGTANAEEYQDMVRQSLVPGHNAVIQGLVWRGASISERTAEALSAHTFCVGLIGAALRLGVIGHTGAQGVLARAHPGVLKIMATPCMGLEEVCAFSPQQEIAVMRHETMPYRLFVN